MTAGTRLLLFVVVAGLLGQPARAPIPGIGIFIFYIHIFSYIVYIFDRCVGLLQVRDREACLRGQQGLHGGGVGRRRRRHQQRTVLRPHRAVSSGLGGHLHFISAII